MEDISKIPVALIGEDNLDMGLFSRMLTAKGFVPRLCGFAELEAVDLSDIRIFFLFPPEDHSILSGAVHSLAAKRESTLVLVSSLQLFKETGHAVKDLIHDHFLYPADNSVIERKLKLYRTLSIAAEKRDPDAYINDLQNRILDLEEQNVAKDKFFAIIAHDLKNPFTGFLGFSEYIAKYYDEISKEDLGDFSVRMYESAQLVYNLIENLLAWSRLRTGNIDFDPIPFDVGEIVERVIKLCETTVTKKQINLVNSMPRKVGAFADANMVDTVVRNVVTNAVKFTPKGGVVHIGATVENGFATIFVADSGIGIPEDRQKKMFRLGYRVSREGTDGESGTGLGLILSKEFMLKNGGDLYFESKEGNGSKFFIKVPTGE